MKIGKLKSTVVILGAVLITAGLFAENSDKKAVKLDFRITVNADSYKHDISPTLTGAFFEDINHGADGGLYAELIENRSFEHINPVESWNLERYGGAAGEMSINREAPINKNNPAYLSLSVENPGKGVGISNDGYKGISVKKDAGYNFSLYLRNHDMNGPVSVRIEDLDGNLLSDIVKIENPEGEWKKYTGNLIANADSSDAVFIVAAEGKGTIDMDMVSLFPKDTWKGRENGLRKDLVKLLADMKPKFFRFPGGCVIEGTEKEDMYRWKDTIGKVEERKANKNLWGYYQTYGLGFYEYFQLCEDIGAEPLPVVNAGMTCQARGVNGTSGYLVPFGEMKEYIQDALDLIEYANGDTTTVWGAKRAESGHIKPFNLKFISVGNEQWGQDYFYRYKMIQKAINERYPDIKIIFAAGPVESGPIFKDAWNYINQNGKNTIVDEHYYMSLEWFLENTARYDSYDKNGSGVFVGEYAAHRGDRKNTLNAAIAEAAYMTGLERNSDVVKLASYAPLFAKIDGYQWAPDMIWFNNDKAYGTPSYYVQKLFSRNVGNKLVESTKQDFAGTVKNEIKGGILLGSWMTGVEYDDVEVTGADGKVIFADKFDNKKAEWVKGAGNWKVEGGRLVLTDIMADARYTFANDKWSDYTFKVKAKKKSGNEGFLIGFAVNNDQDFYWYNIGGWNNTRTVIEKARSGIKAQINEADNSKYGTIKANKEYEIKIVVKGKSLECYLDGELTNKYEEPAAEKDVYTVSSIDTNTNELYVKVVNTAHSAKVTGITLNTSKSIVPEGRMEIITGANGDEENSFDEPQKVKTVTNNVKNFAKEFYYKAPADSVTVFKVKLSKGQEKNYLLICLASRFEK